jgi:hypothetical protein
MKFKVLLSLALLSTTTLALAGSDDAGTKGHVTAYDSDRSTVIDVAACERTKLTWDYVGCGKAFREKTKDRLCKERGKGKHQWYYQVGDSKVKGSQTANCK